MPEAIGGNRELDRNERLYRTIVLATVRQDILHRARTTHCRQEVVHDRPLIVPCGFASGFGMQFFLVIFRVFAVNHVAQVVMEVHHPQLQLADDAVLVIAEITDQRGLVRCPLQIVLAKHIARFLIRAGQKLRAIVEIVAGFRARPVKTIQIQCRCSHVRNLGRVIHPIEAGGHIQCDVMVDELAEKDVPDRHRFGPLGLAATVHRPTRLANFPQHVGRHESRCQVWKHAPEAVFPCRAVVSFAIGCLPGKLGHSVMLGHDIPRI